MQQDVVREELHFIFFALTIPVCFAVFLVFLVLVSISLHFASYPYPVSGLYRLRFRSEVYRLSYILWIYCYFCFWNTNIFIWPLCVCTLWHRCPSMLTSNNYFIDMWVPHRRRQRKQSAVRCACHLLLEQNHIRESKLCWVYVVHF